MNDGHNLFNPFIPEGKDLNQEDREKLFTWMLQAFGTLTTPSNRWDGLTIVGLSPETATEACNLPDDFHIDPADLMIVTTAGTRNLVLITKDRQIFKDRLVKTVW